MLVILSRVLFTLPPPHLTLPPPNNYVTNQSTHFEGNTARKFAMRLAHVPSPTCLLCIKQFHEAYGRDNIKATDRGVTLQAPAQGS